MKSEDVKAGVSQEEYKEWLDLKAKERSLLELLSVGDSMSTKEIADSLGVTRRTVELIIARAIHKISSKWKRRGDDSFSKYLEDEWEDHTLREEVQVYVADHEWYADWDITEDYDR